MAIKDLNLPLKLPEVIYVDVDGTLISRGKVNYGLVDWLRIKYELGFEIVVWSNRGVRNAEMATVTAEIEDIVSHMLSKPGYIVDDKGWDWATATKQIDPKSFHTSKQKTTVAFSD